MNKKDKSLSRSDRGIYLTFNEYGGFTIGAMTKYVVSEDGKEIAITLSDSTKRQSNCVKICRKKSGQKYRCVIDMRSKEIKAFSSSCVHMKAEFFEDKIIVHKIGKSSEKDRRKTPKSSESMELNIKSFISLLFLKKGLVFA